MNKDENKSERGARRRGLERLLGGYGKITLAALLLVSVVFGAAAAWRQWGGLVTNDPQYLIAIEQITITPPPEWIRADIKEQVFISGSLGQLSILDPQAARKAATAFELHPWVAKTLRVSKSPPARLEVELEYRRPAAMVEVEPSGLIPVDAHGAVLPPEDFHPPLAAENMADKYLRVAAGDTTPLGPVGEPWGDRRVHQAAQIAESLRDVWEQCGLFGVEAIPPAANDRESTPQFALFTRKGLRIHWGSAPGEESQREPTASQKVQHLVQLVERVGSLAQVTEEGPFDLTSEITPKEKQANHASNANDIERR